MMVQGIRAATPRHHCPQPHSGPYNEGRGCGVGGFTPGEGHAGVSSETHLMPRPQSHHLTPKI